MSEVGLADKCVACDKAHRYPQLTEQAIWDVFETERPQLVPDAGRAATTTLREIN